MLYRTVQSRFRSVRQCLPNGVAAWTALHVPRHGGELCSSLRSSRTSSTTVRLCTTKGVLCASTRYEHTTTAAQLPEKELSAKEQLDELMESFEEARELIAEASESVGTTYFAEDIEDAMNQTRDVLRRWESLQGMMEREGSVEQLQKVRNMYALRIKQLEAELETVREAGGAG
ncbi:hypothetical protein JKF63_00140 [Porcisia hertigi]|uniref:Uncharacterized protein n=1 Tax=Porcisia hertigi TaxID=2761500 RepID=A0A836HB42_9TRYP|nr:hypothetical protein JKF63_00140 [Porcisia hertigi]